jgi:hypothetical protein
MKGQLYAAFEVLEKKVGIAVYIIIETILKQMYLL